MFRFRNSSVLFCRKTMKTIHNLQKVLCSHRAEYVDDRSVKPEWIAYGHAKQGSFLQAPPKLQNPYVADPPLRSYLRHHVPEEVSKEIESDLKPFGDRIVNEIDALGWECERNLPVLHHQNAWGERVDELITCSAWKKQHDISAEEGLVAIGYERKLQQWREELASYAVSDDIASCLPDLKIAQNTMYRARAAVRPPLPKTLLEIKLEGQWTQTRDGKIFLLFDTVEEGNRVMAFCSPESLEILCHNEQIFFDGTFKLAPKLFCQLYTIHGLYKGKIFPLVYSFLENKKKSTCITLFKNLKTQAEKFGFKFEPSFAMLDYERGATNALEEVLPTIKNKGCYFHYAQAIWRKVQELGLKKSYINCEDTQRWIRRIIALLLVPIEKMSKAFLLLVEDAPAQTTAVRTMTDYLVDTWLDENAVFEMNTWNHWNSDDHRMNNHVEGWHSKLSKRGVAPHPNIFTAIKLLQDIEAEDAAEREMLRSAKMSSFQTSKYININERLVKLKNRFSNCEITLKAYIDAVSFLASSKK